MNQISANAGSNIKSALDELMKDVRQFGREQALGEDAKAKFALRVTRASADGIIDLEKKHGKDPKTAKDDIDVLYKEYVDQYSSKSLHEHKGIVQKTSEMRVFVKFGAMTTCDPVTVLNRAVILRNELAKGDTKVKSAFPSYLNVARAQLDSDQPLTDDQIRECVVPGEPAEKTLEKELGRIAKALEAIITGENKAGLKCQSENVIAAHDAITREIATMVKQRELMDLLQKAADLGLNVSSNVPEQIAA